jgi:hypothetical protein
MRRRGDLVERSFAHILDRRGIRRAWLRGRENVHKRYLIHVAGFNLGRPDARRLRSGNAEGGRRNPIGPDHRPQVAALFAPGGRPCQAVETRKIHAPPPSMHGHPGGRRHLGKLTDARASGAYVMPRFARTRQGGSGGDAKRYVLTLEQRPGRKTDQQIEDLQASKTRPRRRRIDRRSDDAVVARRLAPRVNHMPPSERRFLARERAGRRQKWPKRPRSRQSLRNRQFPAVTKRLAWRILAPRASRPNV